jgi:GR25 family glycosyltransferase involved in LPS biosynthesis
MKPSKAYILRISSNPISVEYAKMASDSCDKVGLKWEYFEGYNNLSPDKLWKENTLGIKHYKKNLPNGEASITAGHFKIWEKIIENKETAIILEHDAVMLHPVKLDIPDNMIVNLGYRVINLSHYDHVEAGAPKEIRKISWHSGAHAYAINHVTADSLLEEARYKGVGLAIDGFFFLRWQSEIFRSSIPIGIIDPIAGVAFVRETTNTSNAGSKSSILNAPLIKSFKDNYKNKE